MPTDLPVAPNTRAVAYANESAFSGVSWAVTLQVPVSFFFEGAPHGSESHGSKEAPSPAYVSDFLATSDGLALTKSFMRIKDAKLRRRIVDLVEQIAGEEDD